MKQIKLTQGKVALVDDEDYDFLNKFKWCFNGRYAARSTILSDGSKGHLLMHRLILLSRHGESTDHRDEDKLNNSRGNLRKCTQTENNRNVSRRKDNTSGYKGVHQTRDLWAAQLSHNGRQLFLGRFKTKQEAAIAYNAAAIVLHREFACLNEVDNG
jgi:hypothetical protein